MPMVRRSLWLRGHSAHCQPLQNGGFRTTELQETRQTCNSRQYTKYECGRWPNERGDCVRVRSL
eukprot:4997476-Prymnesium_polylepis.1